MVTVLSVSQPETLRSVDLDHEREATSEKSEHSLLEPISAFILMGKTGSGKSSFINLLGGKDEDGNDPEVSEELESCTSKSKIYCTKINDRNIVLLDTPGFDDSSKENIVILIEIVSTLYTFALRSSVLQVRGVIFLHDISETRFAGSQSKTLEILKAICGEECMRNVIVGTTMWSPSPKQIEKQERREQAFCKKYWEGIFKTTRLQEDDEAAAVQVILDLLTLPPIRLLVQQEMMEPPHTPENTTVGRLVGAEGRRELEELKVEYNKNQKLFEAELKKQKEDFDNERKAASEKAQTEIKLLETALTKLRHPPDLGWCKRVLNGVGKFFGYGPMFTRIKEVLIETGGRIVDGTFEFFEEAIKFCGKIGGDDVNYDIPKSEN